MIKMLPVESSTLTGALVSSIELEGKAESRILHCLIHKSGEKGTLTLNLPKVIQRGDLTKIADELYRYSKALEEQTT